LSGKRYAGIIGPEYRWGGMGGAQGQDGKLDHHTALTGDDLKTLWIISYFLTCRKFKTSAESAATIEYKIGEIFSELKNKIQSGYNLRK